MPADLLSIHKTIKYKVIKANKFTFLGLLVASCMICLSACQKQGVGVNHSPTSDDRIVLRGDECEHCDVMDDCCCGVELLNDDAATIQICGTTSGGTSCAAATGSCGGSISGTVEVVSLGSSNPKHIFCMGPNTAIRIINLSPTDNAGIRVGCNTVNYTALDYDISPQDSIKAEVNSLANCELSDCTS